MPLSTGHQAPTFSANDQNGDTISSEDLHGRRYVLFFYPRDQTPICTREACTFQDEITAFEALGVPVFGVSTDSVSSHVRFAKKHELTYSLLSDPDGAMVDAFDVRGLLGRTSRTTYIIGPDGTIEGAHRAEFSGKGHAAWARRHLEKLVG